MSDMGRERSLLFFTLQAFVSINALANLLIIAKKMQYRTNQRISQFALLAHISKAKSSTFRGGLSYLAVAISL